MVRIEIAGRTFLHKVVASSLCQEVLEAGLRYGEQNLASSNGWTVRLDDLSVVPLDMELGLFCDKNQKLHCVQRQSPAVVNVAAISMDPAVDWVRLNVGGTQILTSRTTLCADGDSMLAKMFGKWPASRTDETGAFMLDLDPRYFQPILNYLRWGTLTIDPGINVEGVRATAKFLALDGVLKCLDNVPVAGPHRSYKNVMMLACRFASWIGLSGAVPLSVPQKFKFSATRKYGNQFEMWSHSNELVAVILNHLISMGWWVISSSAGGAGGDLAVYQSYLLASDNPEIPDLAFNPELLVFTGNPQSTGGMRSPPQTIAKEN